MHQGHLCRFVRFGRTDGVLKCLLLLLRRLSSARHRRHNIDWVKLRQNRLGQVLFVEWAIDHLFLTLMERD